MGDITLNQIRDLMLWLIAFTTATTTIVTAVKKAIAKGFEPIREEIKTVDMNATKNFLVSQIDEMERNGSLGGVSKQRFFEQYEHYIQKGGNSYIKHEVERLQKEGKL